MKTEAELEELIVYVPSDDNAAVQVEKIMDEIGYITVELLGQSNGVVVYKLSDRL